MPALTRFSSRRGRPRSIPRSTDLGTPELILKRATDHTAEPLDLCLARGFISDAQHRSALHLRWLYTVRYGAPGVTALDLTREQGLAMFDADDPHWAQAREAEYDEAVTALRSAGSYRLILDLCIYNDVPRWLRRDWLQRSLHAPELAQQFAQEQTCLRNGLEILVKLWQRGKCHTKAISSPPGPSSNRVCE